MPIFFYVLYTKILAVGVADETAWDKHFLMSMAVFSVMGSSIITLGLRLVQERNQGWTVYVKTTPVPDAVYFFGKIAGQSAVHAASVAVIFCSGALLNGVVMSAGEWLAAGCWIVMGALPFLALGSLLGTLKKADTASGIGNLLYLALAIAGGLWMPTESLPDVFQKAVAWLPSYQYGAGAWAIAKGEAPPIVSLLVLIIYAVLFMILSMQQRRRQEAD